VPLSLVSPQCHYDQDRRPGEAAQGKWPMSRTLALWSLAEFLAMAGCATPGVLKKPLAAPTMARPIQAAPLPAYATPDPRTHAPSPDDQPNPS